MKKKRRYIYPELYDRDWLNEKYWGEKLSTYKIADILRCTDVSVLEGLKRFNIPRRDYSEVQKGKHHSPETEFKKGNKPWNDGVKGEPNSFFGKTHTKDVCERIAESKIGDKTPAKRKEVREKISGTLKKLWLDPEFAAARVKERNLSPNKLETLVAEILECLYPNEWKYNGDGKEGVVIAGMIPDFINVNNRKRVVEVFGTAYHDPERAFMKVGWKRQEFGRVATYAQLGYVCVALWEDRINAEGIDYIKEEINKT